MADIWPSVAISVTVTEQVADVLHGSARIVAGVPGERHAIVRIVGPWKPRIGGDEGSPSSYLRAARELAEAAWRPGLARLKVVMPGKTSILIRGSRTIDIVGSS